MMMNRGGLLIIFLYLGTTLSGFAQVFQNNGAVIAITQGTTIVLPDSMINNGQISNDGDLVVQGAWINNSTYNAGVGSLTMASSAPQTLNHNDQSLTVLTISGGGDKFFEQDFVLDNELVLDDGLLISLNGARIIVTENASISGANDNSYIVGPIVSFGTGLKYYPVGTEDEFLPMTLENVTGNMPELMVAANADNPNTDIVGTLDDVSSSWYWTLDIVSGDYSGSPVTLAIKQENLIGEFEQMVVAETKDQNNPFHTLGQSNLQGDQFDGSVTSSFDAEGGVYAVGVDLSVTDVSPEIGVFNAVTPNGDNIHDFLKLENIEFYPENTVIIYTKLGSKVFEIMGYDNNENVFEGENNLSGESLPNGTYYYYIDKNNGDKPLSGFFVLSK